VLFVYAIDRINVIPAMTQFEFRKEVVKQISLNLGLVSSSMIPVEER